MDLNQAVTQAVVTTQSEINQSQVTERIAFFDEDGNPVNVADAAAPTGASVTLTGYESGSSGDVAATDSVNAAIAKLEARIAALEAAAT